MEKCIKCGGTLPADAKLCPYCGNPVSYYEEKKQPVPPATRKQARGRTMLILAVVVLGVLLIASLAFAITLWTASPAASPKLGVSPGSLDYGTLQVGSQSSQVLTLSNSGGKDLNWSADKGKADWLTLDPSQGRILVGGSQTINVRADTALLTAGRYSASISFSSNGGGASVSAVLIVASGPPTPGAPVVTSISPTSGPVVGGTTVTITGSGFTGASKVLFGTATSTFTVNSDTQITAVSPGGSGGIVHVTVTTPGGTTTTSNADQFTYLAAPAPIPTIPTIASISPTSGPLAGGTTITIRGSSFTGASKVLFGAVAASSFTVNSATQITAVSPAGSGTVDVRVTTPGGTSATSNADRFTYQVAPTVTGISATSGPAAGGTSVIIRGSNFTGASKVLFGTVPARSFTVNSATQITAVSPAGSGTVDVRVTTPGGTSATSAADRFTYVPAPIVTAVSPNTGPAAGGTTVIITGSGFTGASKVLFGTVQARIITVSAIQITAVSPAGSGTVDVRVTTPGGTSAITAADRFTYVFAQPKVTSILPMSGPTTGGTSVIIRGSNFTGATKVLFGTVPASSFTVNSATQITAVSPAGSGTVDVRVTTPGGTSLTSTADRFTYVPAPIVTAITPKTGPAAGGTTIIITGTGFTGASKVVFGTVAASSFTLNSDIQITAVSPAGSGTVDVRVTTPGGTSAIAGADQFTYVFAQPKIMSILPTSGPTTGRTSVTITGSDFTGATKVLFGTVAASSFTVNSATQITAVSPAGSGTVDVRVTTPGGTSATSTADRFTYVPAPTVTAVSPKTGPAAGGTTIIITGTGFTGASKVVFGTVAASSFTLNSDIQITAVSPAGSGTVDVRVTTPGGTSAIAGADQFTYVFAQPKITSISPTSGPVAGGTPVTITGSSFTGATKVLFGTVAASRFMVNSATQITTVSPAAAGSGTVDVTVTTPGGMSAISMADKFTYVAPPAIPTIASISPTSGPVAGGTPVTITGSNFTGATKVLFGAVAASSFTVNSATQITAVSPAAAGSGTVDVTVTTPGGTSAISPADKFTYVAPPAIPIVTGISPTSGPAAGGATVTIIGSGFTGASKVLFGTVAASGFTVDSQTQITAVSPAGSGTVDVRVTTPGGTSVTSNADQFTYVAPPAIPIVTGISPTTGPVAGGTTVTITGSGFHRSQQGVVRDSSHQQLYGK